MINNSTSNPIKNDNDKLRNGAWLGIIIKDEKRFLWAACIFILSVLIVFFILLCILSCKIKFLHNFPDDFLNNYFLKILWTLSFSFMGFSSLAFYAAITKKYPNPPWASYIFTYFPRLIAVSLVIFSVLTLCRVDGPIYYIFSAGLGFFLGYTIDSIKVNISS